MSFLEENKIPLSMLKINFLSTGSKFSGCFRGKRYLYEPIFDDNKTKKEILLHIYPDKLCFEKTDKNNIETKSFSFDDSGLSDSIKYLESIFDK